MAGPWTGGSSSQSYSVLFDAEPVEACLVQPGVLRCRCPAHAPGIASLQVACDGFVVSDSVAFEYRKPPSSEPSPEKALLDRLADVEARLQGPGPPSPAAHLEERLVAYCQVGFFIVEDLDFIRERVALSLACDAAENSLNVPTKVTRISWNPFPQLVFLFMYLFKTLYINFTVNPLHKGR